jgi:glutathione S-transferase
MSSIIAYGINTLRTLRVHWTLHELGIAYQTQPIQSRSRQTQTSEYKAINLGHKIPSLQDGELIISESAAICIYLAEKYGNDTLIPIANLAKRARFFQVCFYVMTELDAHTLYIIAKHGGSLMQFYKPSPEAVDVAIAGFNQQILVANSWLENSNSYILGEIFTVADIILCTCLISANKLAMKFPLQIPDKLQVYAATLQTRPNFQNARIVNQLKKCKL